MDLYEYDLEDLPEFSSIVCLGKRRSGKSFLTRDLAYNHFRSKKVKTCYLFSPTCNIAQNPMDFVPLEYRYPELDIEVIESILKRQEYLIRMDPKGKYHTLIVMDDLMSSLDAKQRKVIDKLFITARHYQISIICNYQYLKTDFTPMARDNCDILFIFQQNNLNNKIAIVEQYLSVSRDKNAGYEIIEKNAKDYQCLVVTNTSLSGNYQDFCFHYSASDTPKFKLGKEYC